MLGFQREKVIEGCDGWLTKFFYFCNFAADEGNESSPRRRVSVNPIFCVISVVIARTNFLIGVAQRGSHHLGIHAHNGTMIFNAVLVLRRERIEPLLCGRLLRKIEK